MGGNSSGQNFGNHSRMRKYVTQDDNGDYIIDAVVIGNQYNELTYLEYSASAFSTWKVFTYPEQIVWIDDDCHLNRNKISLPKLKAISGFVSCYSWSGTAPKLSSVNRRRFKWAKFWER